MLTIPINWTERARIPNLPQLTEQVRLHGGSIVEFQRVWSLLLYCQSRPVYRWIPAGKSRIVAGFGHALFCFFLGWWSPAGIVWTLPAVVNNLFGGVDVTKVFTQPPPLPGQEWDPVASAEYIASRRRQGILTLLSVVLIVGTLGYLGCRDIGSRRASRKTVQTVSVKPGERLADRLMDEESQVLRLRVRKYGKERDAKGTDLYVKIAEPLRPLERWKKYEDPLVAALHNGNLGEVTGGGAMMHKDGTIEYCRIDVIVTDPPDKGIAAIKAVLRTTGAPNGNQIQYADSDEPVEDNGQR